MIIIVLLHLLEDTGKVYLRKLTDVAFFLRRNNVSCRRGKEKNGDVDLLVSSSKSAAGLLDQLTKCLIAKGYLKHKLWSSTQESQTRRLTDNFEKVNICNNMLNCILTII